MITYLEKYDTTVELPDDFTDKELADLNENFASYVGLSEQQESEPQKQDGGLDPSVAGGVGLGSQVLKQDFFESFIKPNFLANPAMGLGSSYVEETDSGKAFGGKMIEGFTFGLSKPLTNRFEEQYAEHPIESFAGEAIGTVGSFMVTKGALMRTPLLGAAKEAGAKSVTAGFAAGSRFIPSAIMESATFGTHTFIKKAVESFQAGSVDIVDFGTSVARDSILGAGLGAISAVSGFKTAVGSAFSLGFLNSIIEKDQLNPSVASAVGLGYTASKMEGGDYVEALLNGTIWGLFEAVGSFGRDARLRKGALETLGESIGDYTRRRYPEAPKEAADQVGKAIVVRMAESHTGLKGEAAIDAVANSSKEDTLAVIEAVNSRVRQSKIKTQPKLEGPTQPTQSPAALPETPTQDAGLPTDVQKPSVEIAPVKTNVAEAQPQPEKPRSKKTYDTFDDHKETLGEIAGELDKLEGYRFNLVRDGDGNVINRTQTQGYTPEFLKGLNPNKKKDIELISKAIARQPLTEKQHARVLELLEAKTKWEEAENEREAELARKQDIQDDLQSGFTQEEIAEAARRAEEDAERAAIQEDDGEVDFEPETYADSPFQSSKLGAGRNFGGEEDRKLKLSDEISNRLGGLKEISAITGGPEIVKLAKMVLGDTPSIKRVMESLGYFMPKKEEIALWSELFKENPLLWKAVLLHEIGHAMDYMPDKTMAKGNVLGRIASLKGYRASLLPESPQSKEHILTDNERAKFRRMAEEAAKQGKQPDAPVNQFDPQAILNIFNSISGGESNPALLEYVKRLDTANKKALVLEAMKAMKKGENVTIADIQAFNKNANADPVNVADIYREYIKEEIKKRKLWEEEVIREEMKALSQYWKPFDASANAKFTSYRYSAAELYADFISALLLAPNKVNEIAPNSLRAYFNYLGNKPDIFKSLIEIQNLIQGDNKNLQAVRLNDIFEMYERGENVMRAQRAAAEAAKTSPLMELKQFLWDTNAKIYDLAEKIRNKQKAYTPQSEDEIVQSIEEYSMMRPFVRALAWDFHNVVLKDADALGIRQHVSAVLQLERTAEDRKEFGNPLGFDEESSKQLLKHLEETDPVKYRQMLNLASAARQWFRNLQNAPGAEDFYSPEQIWTMGQDDKYVPFRVQKYMQEFVSAGFAKQYGTFEDTGDTLTALFKKGISSAVAIEKNRLRLKIVDQLILNSGIADITPLKVTNIAPGKIDIEKPKKPGMGTIAVKRGGKTEAYAIDKDIAESFNSTGVSDLAKFGGALSTVFGNRIFKALWITFNPTFQFVNLTTYDFWRNFKTIYSASPNLSYIGAFKKTIESYAKAFPAAYNRAKGVYDPLIQQMEREKALQVTYNDMILGQTGDDIELDLEFEKFDIIMNRESKWKGIPVAEQISGIFDALRFTSDLTESLSKVAGWKALDFMTTEERSYYIRNLIGTPSFTRTGKAAPVVNAIFPFSNVFKEAFRGLIELAYQNKKTRGKYFLAGFVGAVGLKIMQKAIEEGMFGQGPQEVMKKASEYHKTNYFVIPLGIDSNENGVYLTLPQDHDARFIGGLAWKMLGGASSAVKGDGIGLQNLQDILSFGAEQYPASSPGMRIIGAYFNHLIGRRVYDSFREQDVIGQQERDAGGMYAFEPLIKWTLNETGVTKFDVHDKLTDQPIYKQVLQFTPILQRFVRISNFGAKEALNDAGQEARKKRARESLDIESKAKETLRKKDKSVTASEFAEQFPREMRERAEDTYSRLEKGFTNDPGVQALMYAQSNEEKVAIIKEMIKTFVEPGAAEDYIRMLRKSKIISKEALQLFNRDKSE